MSQTATKLSPTENLTDDTFQSSKIEIKFSDNMIKMNKNFVHKPNRMFKTEAVILH